MLLRRYFVLSVTACLIIATLFTSVLVQRQTALVPDVIAAPPQLPGTPTAVAGDSRANPTPPTRNEPEATQPTPTLGVEVAPPETPRAALINRDRFFYEPDFYGPQIQAWLETQPGPLKGYRTTIGNREHSFADVLSSQAIYFNVNPKVLLALIEQQSGFITNPSPSEEQQRWMVGYRGDNENWPGWLSQLRWARRELRHAVRDYPSVPDLVYADQSHSPPPPGLSVADYAVARVLAATTTAGELPAKLDQGKNSFVATYTRLFGDPRDAPKNWPKPAAPFLSLPMDGAHQTTSFFDHEAPFLQQNGSIVTYRGDRNERLSYDGHDGWDYGMLVGEPVLAAAEGTVVFVGNADDGCATRAVVIDHGNGYRTLYWHLQRPTVELGPVKRGDQIGLSGASGCANGPHLHFGVQYLGRNTDVSGWCGPNGGDPWTSHPGGQVSTWLWRDVPSPCELPKNAIVVDTTDPGFKRTGEGWNEAALGFGGTALLQQSTLANDRRFTIGTWRPQLPQAGKYRVLAWVPYILSDLKDAENVQYIVGHADGSGDTQQVKMSQWDSGNGWADLGVYSFDPARKPFVGLTPADSEAGNNVWYDAVVWIPVE